jgi:hypothetical protein
MCDLDRRGFLRLFGQASLAAAVSLPMLRAFAGAPENADEFFVFIHAAGGWDVTLWSDPRNERMGLIEPASTDNTDTTGVRRWVDVPLDSDTRTFEIVQPSGSNIRFGAAIGNLADLYDRICLVNGLSMNTVSHPDGIAYSLTGRHLAGGRTVASSIDTMVGNELGTSQLFPVVSVKFLSSFVGDGLDPRALPMRVDSVDSVSRSLNRSTAYDLPADRDAVTVLLSQEATDLAAKAYHPEALQGFALHFDSLRRMLSSNLQNVFTTAALRTARPEFNYAGRFQGRDAVSAAFAVEALKRNVVRCVSFALGGLDTHNSNYRNHALILQEIFDMIAALLGVLDATPHPTRTAAKLSDHTHILVLSDFCRTPQVNLAGGRDHYPNNSALVISPKFKSNFVYGQTDPAQLLPGDAGTFSDGTRPVAPPDLLATFVSAFGVNPRKYLRDGEVVGEMLRS